MGTNNSINFPNLTSKTAPVTDDIGLIADSAASNVLKQATLGTYPVAPVGAFLAGGAMIAAMPGALSGTQSNTQTQTLASPLNTRVFLQPFCLNVDYTTGSLGAYVITGVAASSITIGLYNNNGSLISPQPSGAAFMAVSLATTSNNTFYSSSAITLLKAKTIYWAAIQTSTATTLSLQCTQMNLCCNIANGTTAGTGYAPVNVTYTNTYSAGSLPNITPGLLSTSTITYSPVVIIG